MNVRIKETQLKNLVEQSMGGAFSPQYQSGEIAKIAKEGLDHNVSVVLEILNVASIDFPSGASSMLSVLPIGLAESCSKFNFTFVGFIDPDLNITLPVDAFAGTSN